MIHNWKIWLKMIIILSNWDAGQICRQIHEKKKKKTRIKKNNNTESGRVNHYYF